MPSLLVITNRDAGAEDADTLDAALAVLRDGADVEVCATGSPEELDEVLAGRGERWVVVAGGDGSMHAVVAELHRLGTLPGAVIGLLPLGTGNDLARGAGLPLDVVEAARVVLAGERRTMDLILDDAGGVVVNNVHAGAGAQASRRGARWKTRLHAVGVGRVNLGKLGYPMGAVLASFRPPFVRLRVEVDGRAVTDRDQHVLMVAVGNGSRVGGGTPLNPDADPGDGELDVVISLATGPVSRFGYVASLLRGRHTDREDVLHLRGTRILLEGEPFYCSADGEIRGPMQRASWQVRPAAYDLLVPA